ncbi:cytochrome c oxidase subunit IV [Sediminihabitans luteus]|uniref:Cytochrome c oxidase polypeptide 4 n=1 Tax=Sediminihabitans luteus TaxID=1138585 RepID=A0A2M9CQ38_9CELL|nr:cytochrome c oxidase subunit 4 [Sediminihabitans luteus]PJJ74042.1 cytochrome c oxidase subunit IV [Sediminihabitans luteus]GII98043.1 putative cytochrome c oxidase polypeptide 4 [Sediminihabitans luteus]
MKTEIKFFLFLAPFFVLMGLIYGFWTDWQEPVGPFGILLSGALVAMVGAYLSLTARRIDDRPEDDPEGLIEQGAGDQGVYAPWSWWPLAIGATAAIVFASLAIGWWLFYIGAALGVVALVGWVMEFSRGQHAH